MPRFALLCGLPRSGKSTLARQAREAGWTIVCPDTIRLALHGRQHIDLAEPFVWATAQVMARALLLDGHDTLLDATNVTRAHRRQWVELARAFGQQLEIVVIATPYAVCRARNADPAYGPQVPMEVLDRMARAYEPPTAEEGAVYDAELWLATRMPR